MRKISRAIFAFLGISLLLFSLPYLAQAEDAAKGNIIGFVFDQDGTSPVEGAVVKIKNVTTEKVYQSSKSDANGVFRIKAIESGIYLCGVQTAQGGFNSDELFGVKVSEGETAKLSVALTPYEQKVASALQEVYEGQTIAGESLVGTVVDYYPETQSADVLVVKGLLRMKDRIHAKGDKTDFYQNVGELKLENSPAKKVFAGQTANLKMDKSVNNGDLVYLVCNKRGIIPLFPASIGYVTLVAGSLGVVLGFGDAVNNAIFRQGYAFKK